MNDTSDDTWISRRELLTDMVCRSRHPLNGRRKELARDMQGWVDTSDIA